MFKFSSLIIDENRLRVAAPSPPSNCYYCLGTYHCHLHRAVRWTIMDYRRGSSSKIINPTNFYYFCNICFEIQNTAILLLCGHLLCEECMFQILQNELLGKTLTCPTCKIVHKLYYYLGLMNWDNVMCEMYSLCKDQSFVWKENTLRPLRKQDRLYFHQTPQRNIIAICNEHLYKLKCRKYIRIFTDIIV